MNSTSTRLLVPLVAVAIVIGVAAALSRPGGGTLPSHNGQVGGSRPTQSTLGQHPAGAPGGPNRTDLDGQQLVLAAAGQLSQGPAISARLHQRVKLQSGDVLGVGSYRQEAFQDGGRFHLQLRTKVGALLSVSDGNYIWRQLAIGESRRITRTDLQHDRLTGSYGDRSIPGGISGPLRSRTIPPLELGGLGHLLTVLARTYRFEEAQQKVLSDVPIYEVRGVLIAESDNGLREGATVGEPGPPASHPTPPQIPSHVLLSLGADDLFPYRIVFDTRNADPDDEQRGVPRRVEIQFSEVSLGGAIDNRWFEYSPPRDVAWEDIAAESLPTSSDAA